MKKAEKIAILTSPLILYGTAFYYSNFLQKVVLNKYPLYQIKQDIVDGRWLYLNDYMRGFVPDNKLYLAQLYDVFNMNWIFDWFKKFVKEKTGDEEFPYDASEVKKILHTLYWNLQTNATYMAAGKSLDPYFKEFHKIIFNHFKNEYTYKTNVRDNLQKYSKTDMQQSFGLWLWKKQYLFAPEIAKFMIENEDLFKYKFVFLPLIKSKKWRDFYKKRNEKIKLHRFDPQGNFVDYSYISDLSFNDVYFYIKIGISVWAIADLYEWIKLKNFNEIPKWAQDWANDVYEQGKNGTVDNNILIRSEYSLTSNVNKIYLFSVYEGIKYYNLSTSTLEDNFNGWILTPPPDYQMKETLYKYRFFKINGLLATGKYFYDNKDWKRIFKYPFDKSYFYNEFQNFLNSKFDNYKKQFYYTTKAILQEQNFEIFKQPFMYNFKT